MNALKLSDFPIGASLAARASQVLAGGVSSDARRGMPLPVYMSHGSGSHLTDVDGHDYVDFVLGQGPLVLGHSAPAIVDAVSTQVALGQTYAGQHALEVDAAELVAELVPCAELVRFNTVGSEAALGAWRIARGYTGRSKVLKFEGHYHGWLDPALFSLHPALELAGPADTPHVVPGTGGQQMSGGFDLVIAPWNDLGALTSLLVKHHDDIAAIVLEPLLCNTGCISPAPGFLEAVRALCDEYGIVLIFDEVITGFRLAPGGAQEYFGVTPDLAVFGKAIAGGIPVAAIAGSAKVMGVVAGGTVSHAGTFNSNPVGMAATVATLTHLRDHRDEVYSHMQSLGGMLMQGIRERAQAAGVDVLVDGPGQVFQTYFTSEPAVRNYRDFAQTDLPLGRRFHGELLSRGVNIVPRGLWFLSAAHSVADVEHALDAVEQAFAAL
ncbi:aspartate aminotransferase family protein [Microcella sp.]|uniref:aspartate aminotransferase family protein n=1 Tax=Microcella sp. TaxID=1913979 RepID=UPI00255D1F8D|nr:aspartate aminotransferase family protein [Microcella sp.]MBX9471930.1 aspartate aminotransferase family protein [Microcella sp.]